MAAPPCCVVVEQRYYLARGVDRVGQVQQSDRRCVPVEVYTHGPISRLEAWHQHPGASTVAADLHNAARSVTPKRYPD
jgi:hypothetical protein